MIRRAVLADIPELVRLGAHWHAKSHWPAHAAFIPEDLSAWLMEALEAAILLVSDEGGITGTICYFVTPLYFNRSARIGQEFFWFSDDPRTGLRLLKEAERLAGEAGATSHVIGSQLNDERTARVYGRLGYEPFSGNFVKGI